MVAAGVLKMAGEVGGKAVLAVEVLVCAEIQIIVMLIVQYGIYRNFCGSGDWPGREAFVLVCIVR